VLVAVVVVVGVVAGVVVGVVAGVVVVDVVPVFTAAVPLAVGVLWDLRLLLKDWSALPTFVKISPILPMKSAIWPMSQPVRVIETINARVMNRDPRNRFRSFMKNPP